MVQSKLMKTNYYAQQQYFNENAAFSGAPLVYADDLVDAGIIGKLDDLQVLGTIELVRAFDTTVDCGGRP